MSLRFLQNALYFLTSLAPVSFSKGTLLRGDSQVRKTIKAIYVWHKIEARSPNYCYPLKAMIIKHYMSLCPYFGGRGGPMPPHVLVDFVVLPPGYGSSVTDF